MKIANMMKIANIMSREVKLINPDDTLRDAATLMKTIDAGALPVAEGDRLIGLIWGKWRASESF